MPASPVYRHLGVRKHKDITIVRFGEHRIFDELAIDKLGEELYSVADHDDCRKLVLNFAGVDRVSSMMLGKILMLNRRLQAKGGKLALCELDPGIREIIETTKLSLILELYESEGDALDALA